MEDYSAFGKHATGKVKECEVYVENLDNTAVQYLR